MANAIVLPGRVHNKGTPWEGSGLRVPFSGVNFNIGPAHKEYFGLYMVKICYRCHKPLGEIEPLNDSSEIIKGICEDCLKMETIDIQWAMKRLRNAGRI